MRPLRLTLLAAPLALAVGCLLPSFETLDEPPGSGGSGGTSGSGGSTGGTDEGGAPSQGGEHNAGGQGGEGGTNTAPVVEDDVYVLVQGNELSRIASQGVLSNDSGEELTVTDLTPSPSGAPSSYAPEFEIEPDGSFSFVPVPEFFGAFRATYEVSDSAGNTAEGQVTIYVQPREADVAALADGVGGFCVDAAGADGVGSAIAGVGDGDGDGYDDFAIGAPNANSDAGRLYVVRGAPAGESFALEALTPESDEARYFVIDGEAGSNLGAAVSGAGDMNDDGLPDFVAGAPGANSADGIVYAIRGLASPPAQVSAGEADALEFSGANADAASKVLADGFDLDGDGIPDPVVVVDFASSTYKGRYYAVSGASELSDSLSDVALGHVDGATANDYFTQAVASVGDVTGDGDNDLVLVSDSVLAVVKGPIGAFPADLGASFAEGTDGFKLARNTGSNASVAGAGDIDGDGENDVLFCNGLQNCKVVFGPVEDLIAGLLVEGFAGTTLLTAVADLTGDAASEALFSDGETVYVVFGGSLEKDGSFDITDLPNADGFIVSGAGGPIESLAPVGDVNGDGHQDLAFGVPTAPGTDARVCVMYGTPKAP